MSVQDRAAALFRDSMTEEDMLATLDDLIRLKHGRLWHLRDARRAPELVDLPDIIAIVENKVVIVELKSIKRPTTTGQRIVAEMLDACDTLIVGTFRPFDFDDLLEAIAG